MKTKRCFLPASLLAALSILAAFAQLTPLKAQDINLAGYTLTFDDEFNSLSVTTSSPKAPSTWYFWPPYGAAGAYSYSSWNINSFSVANGILSDKLWAVFNDNTSGNHCYGPLGLEDGTGRAVVTGQTLGTARTYEGWVGMEFTTGSNGLTVSSLGRWVISGNSGSHPVKLVDATTGADVPNGSATVNTSGSTAGAFAYGNLPANVTLAASHSYYLLSYEGGYYPQNGDQFYNDDTTVITASAVTVNASVYPSWNSGNLSSMDPTGAGFGQQYGYFEIRCQMPSSGVGAWPAFWIESQNSILNNDNGTSLPNEEIDIFEWYGTCYTNPSSSIQEASHNWTPSGGPAGLYSPGTPMPGGAYPWQGYHIYGCQVDPANITWYIDGVQTNQIATPAGYITSPFYMMVDYAIGGGWPLSGIVNTSSLNVDWVRVYALPASGAPSAPAGLTATAGNAQAVLNWTTSAGAASYNIYRGTSAGGEGAAPIASGITATSDTDTGLTNGTTYYYVVAAVNSSGTSTASNEASATPSIPMYPQWASLYFTAQQLANPSISGEAATPWNDGVTNVLKYLCDINPSIPMNASAWTALPAVGMMTLGGSSCLTLTYRQSQSETGLTINLQTSSDLQNWQTVTPIAILTTGTDPTTGDPLVQYRVLVNPPDASNEFARLQIIQPAFPSIGIDFSGAGVPLASGSSAGVAPQAYWNNLSSAPPPTSSGATYSSLTDSTGATVSGFSVQLISADNGSSEGVYEFEDDFFQPGGDYDLNSSSWFVIGSPSSGWGGIVKLAGIPYSFYDVIVYTEGDAGVTSTVNLDGTFTNSGITGGTTVNYSEGGAMSSYVGAVGTGGTANYVEFSGVTGPSATINLNAGGSSGGCVGIQILDQ